MKEKLNEYPIDRSITAEARTKIDGFIDANAARFGRAVTRRWEGDVLHLASEPVEWELEFHPDRVESRASAPFWAKMLLTQSVREKVDGILRGMLEEAGLVGKL
jgi:hypothetical protein